MRSVTKCLVVAFIVGLLVSSGSLPASAAGISVSANVSVDVSPDGLCQPPVARDNHYCQEILLARTVRSTGISLHWAQFLAAEDKAQAVYQASVAAGRDSALAKATLVTAKAQAQTTFLSARALLRFEFRATVEKAYFRAEAASVLWDVWQHARTIFASDSSFMWDEALAMVVLQVFPAGSVQYDDDGRLLITTSPGSLGSDNLYASYTCGAFMLANTLPRYSKVSCVGNSASATTATFTASRQAANIRMQVILVSV